MDDPGESAGEWCTVAEAARRLGVTPRAIRLRVKHRSLEARPRGNAGREVFVPAGTAPRGAPPEAQGSIAAEAPGELPEPAGLVEVVVKLRHELAAALTRAAHAEGRAEVLDA